jgi:hypothetical protein
MKNFLVECFASECEYEKKVNKFFCLHILSDENEFSLSQTNSRALDFPEEFSTNRRKYCWGLDGAFYWSCVCVLFLFFIYFIFI